MRLCARRTFAYSSRMSHSITIKDIALKLDLSISTVGRALADSPQISAKTKARVRQAALALGYVAHSGARAMRSGHSTLVGLLIPDVENDFYGTVAKALAECCNAAGYQLVLAVSEEDRELERRQLLSLIEARAAGVVLVGSATPHPDTLTMLKRMKTVQLIRRIDALESAWFGVDDAMGLKKATEYLIGKGHKRIAYIGGSRELSTGSQRLAGYESALRAAGLPVRDELVHTGTPRPAFAAEAFETMWGLNDRPTAVVTGGTRLTVGVLDAIAHLGIKVPEALSVVGFGDAPWYRWWGSGLTTIGLPVREIAVSCGEYLLRQVREDSHEQTSRPFHAVHAPYIIERASVAAPGG